MPRDPAVVSDLAEQDLLDLILPHLPVGSGTLVPPGDDAAVVAAPDGRYVVTCDVLVEDVHFRRRWSSGQDVGRRAAMQNLADVAAMGARSVALVVGLVVPGETPVAWVEDLARGLGDACRPLDVGVVGGDLSSGPALMVSVTAHGDLEGRVPVRRGGARPGDVIAHAGRRGWSAAGLGLLTAGREDTDPGLVAAYRSPEPVLAAGPAAARAGATAMLDVSDGLLVDAGRLARASGVTLALDAPGDAFADDVARLAPAAALLGADPLDWVLAGGEDHGLLATFPPGAVLPPPFRAVGVVRERGTEAVLVAGAAPTVAPGWDHFGR
ncbi:thiamine-phosphate kinase [Cellulomonas sp. zg-ZUI199]|uniref:Thiamine-monophosphate kinase n=1 Tax=Cellulomonas wangleii TaxID=2816956 RepID=A0ABX8D105_9CELL|nr:MULTISPECIES: thiamine-phosphate kinase [Cellulomonas]MBO0899913.1 thiamine-phosphate kinase [Cellulomonas sp. zg-ZUI22]MBO0925345.1 thiamine-phosphate kinase [Cellulomonas wangleii]QVI61162.1 thiamine-phosphate kinase [Cellulomonas wangleii]